LSCFYCTLEVIKLDEGLVVVVVVVVVAVVVVVVVVVVGREEGEGGEVRRGLELAGWLAWVRL